MMDELQRIGVKFRKNAAVSTLRKLCIDNGCVGQGVVSAAADEAGPSAPPPATTTPAQKAKNDMIAALKAKGVATKKKISIPELFGMCVNEEIPGYKYDVQTRVVKTTVKCALRSAMNLDGDRWTEFRAKIDDLVNVISRMLRRTSLALAHHVQCVLEDGHQIPDLERQKDTYWKRWLRVGMIDEWPVAEHVDPHLITHVDVRDDGTVGLSLHAQSDDGALVRRYFERIAGNVGKVLDAAGGDYVRELPPSAYFDQVLNFAGHTLETVVVNNAFVPLLARLTRLSKNVVDTIKRRQRLKTSFTNYHVMNAIKSGIVHQGTPVQLRAWIAEVRARLGVAAGVRVHDDYAKTKLGFEEAVRFNAWMQRRFVELKVRRIKVMPIFGVQRVHVRLDAKVLVEIVKQMFPDLKELAALKAMQTWGAAEVKRGGMGYSDPEDNAEWFPKFAKKTKKSLGNDEALWAEHKAEEALHLQRAEAVRATDEYKAQLQKRQTYLDARHAVVTTLFNRLPRKKAPWVFDCSVMTDGVSLSLPFTRRVPHNVIPKSIVPTQPKAKLTDGVERSSSRSDDVGTDKWDRNAATNFVTGRGETLVAGLDGGRSNLADVSYLHRRKGANGKDVDAHGHFRLTRGDYYCRSGIRGQDSAKARRWAAMDERWATLQGDGTALRAADSASIVGYLEAYTQLSEDWWKLALKRVESRANLQRYVGKRHVLDKFFSDVKKSMEKDFPNAEPEIAYGSAVQGMKATGPGEVAAPVGEAFKACKRIFRDRLCIVDENFTTKNSWETGETKELVYLVPGDVVDGKQTWRLAHTDKKRAPVVAKEHVAAVEAYNRDNAIRGTHRRGGKLRVEDDKGGDDTHVDPEYEVRKLHYPEVRGLRFCPRTRKYLDRDKAASLTIARLRSTEKQGLPRPRPFCRPP